MHWDSNFFGYNVGSITLHHGTKINLLELNNHLSFSDYHLIYLFCDGEFKISEIQKSIPKAELVDEKVTFVKSLCTANGAKITKNIRPAYNLNESMYNIALQTGVYSRFNTDKKIGNANYKRLYRTWLEESISRKICDEVFIWTDESEIEGLITLGFKNGCMNIGLIGVDKGSRGKGIATSLLKRAEHYTIVNGIKKIQVVTQAQNIPAVNLYLKAGYTQESVINVFHIWK